MPLIQPSIAQICKSLAIYLNGEFGGGDTSVRVLLGSPADAVPGDTDSDHRLNLFVFKFDPAGIGADTLPGDIQMLRIHCLATPFAVAEGNISSGENDLRIIGELIRILQEVPVFAMEVSSELFHIQVILLALDMDQLNQLWATQGDTVYRPSIALEISLVPVIPSEPRVGGPLAGAAGLDVRAEMIAGDILSPAVAPRPLPVKPDTRRENWAPALGLVHSGNLAYSLNFEVGSAALQAFIPSAWIAGEPGAAVALVWEVWDSSAGWRQGIGPTPSVIASTGLNPEDAAAAPTIALAAPFNDRAGQMVLYATRNYTRASDGAVLTVRSNPVLINLFEVSP